MNPYVIKSSIKFSSIAYVNFLYHLFVVQGFGECIMWSMMVCILQILFSMIEIIYIMNLSIIIQVWHLLIFFDDLLCNYLHCVNKCILDYLTKLYTMWK
jgi:hypothetical protein